MIQTVYGEFYNHPSRDMDEVAEYARGFFKDAGHENDIIAARTGGDELIYISAADIRNGRVDDGNYVRFSLQMFKEARKNRHLAGGGVLPVLDEMNEPVLLMKLASEKSHIHRYEQITGEADARVFDLYDAIVMMDVTEYAFILLSDALSGYKGPIVCAGRDWPAFERLFAGRENIVFIEDKEKLPPGVLKCRTMFLMEFNSIMAGHEERCREGFFSYDEIMTLVYFFSIRKSYGDKNPDKKFYLVDPVFPMEGLMSICDKCQAPYSYAEANGFVPVIRLTQSDRSIYSDYEGDDIWGKFFDQPYGPEADEWAESANVWQFPEACVTFPDRWLMRRIAECRDVSLMNTFFINDRVRGEIDSVREGVLPDPRKTIGVLIRGTDYTVSHLPGHTRMAGPEQVMEKIEEMAGRLGYGHIFLSTEDADILERMKELCGDRLSFIEQKRFRIRPGELLADQGQDQQPKPYGGSEISPQQAQQMLQAIQAQERQTQDKVNKEKAAALKSRQKEKNW